MNNRTSIIMGGMAAAIALTATTAGATSLTPLYGGGSTLAEKVYRDVFDAYGSTASGDLCSGLTTVCPTTHYNAAVEALYVGVGSGNAVKALDLGDPSQLVSGMKTPDKVPTPSGRDFGAFYGTGTGAEWTPGTGVGPYYPKITFGGSDNILASTDVTAITALKVGAPIQIPTLIAAIAVPFHPTATWTPKGTQPTGGSSKVQLSTNTLCGIFTGKITNWDNAEIKADNKGTTLGSGKITVVYRHDSSGTTFLFSNALLNQCGTTSHGVAHITHRVPDSWLTDNGIVYSSATPHYQAGTSFFINVFNANHLPANFYNDNGGASGVVGGVSGSGGVRTAITNTVGAIGYVSPDFVQPIDSSGPQAANLQTHTTTAAGSTPTYKAPTAANATYIMVDKNPPTGSNIKNPLKWGVVNPVPTSSLAYPIGGFTFIDLYSCYASSATVKALVGNTSGSVGLLNWFYGSTTVNKGIPDATLAQDGFSRLPNIWKTAILSLVDSTTLGIQTAKTGACKSSSGA